MLDDKAWLQVQVKTKPLRHIAKDLGVPYSRVQAAVKRLEVELPVRHKYFYTEESRKAKSDHIKAALEVRYPGGRYGELASNWRGGKNICPDCGNRVVKRGAIRCVECERTINRLGEKNQNWQGGISTENNRIRTSREMKIWRKAVFERDDYTCQICGNRSGKDNPVIIHADHIKPFAHYPELRFAIDNGRTLCIDCHKATDTYAGRARKKV